MFLCLISQPVCHFVSQSENWSKQVIKWHRRATVMHDANAVAEAVLFHTLPAKYRVILCTKMNLYRLNETGYTYPRCVHDSCRKHSHWQLGGSGELSFSCLSQDFILQTSQAAHREQHCYIVSQSSSFIYTTTTAYHNSHTADGHIHYL